MNIIPGIKDIIGGVGNIIDDLHLSDEEEKRFILEGKKLDIEEKRIYADLSKNQVEVNKTEAKHDNVFIAGWRPFIGWIGGVTMLYQFILYPLMTWFWIYGQTKEWIPAGLEQPPVADAQELWVIITGMLGIAGMRSFDKTKRK